MARSASARAPNTPSANNLRRGLATRFREAGFDELVSKVTYKGFLDAVVVLKREKKLSRRETEIEWRLLLKKRWNAWGKDMPLGERKVALSEACAQTRRCDGFDGREFWADLKASYRRDAESEAARPQSAGIAAQVITFNEADLVFHIETGLKMPPFKQGFKFIAKSITYKSFLDGLDLVNGPVLDPAKAAAAWRFFLELKLAELETDWSAEVKAANLERAYSQVNGYYRFNVQQMQVYWENKATNPRPIKMPTFEFRKAKKGRLGSKGKLAKARVVAGGDDMDMDGEWLDEDDGDDVDDAQMSGFFNNLTLRPAN